MSQRQNTNNPIPSNELADLNDNTLIIDEFANSKADYTQDRFGNKFRTIKKYTRDLEDLIVEVSKDSSMPKSGGSFSGNIFVNNIPVLKRGDYGLGAGGITFVNSNIDDQTSVSSGFYSAGVTTKGTLPENATYFGAIIQGTRGLANSKKGFQLYIDTSKINMHIRAANDSNWSKWFQVITTANISTYSSPVGIPQPWPTLTPPSGWLKCNGAAFDKVRYPKLALAYPSGKLPDLRGEFIRGLDDGRGVDSTRAILSSQGDAIRNIKGDINAGFHTYNSKGSGPFFIPESNRHNTSRGANITQQASIGFDASLTVPTANENRPRNIAFLYIVKAE